MTKIKTTKSSTVKEKTLNKVSNQEIKNKKDLKKVEKSKSINNNMLSENRLVKFLLKNYIWILINIFFLIIIIASNSLWLISEKQLDSLESELNSVKSSKENIENKYKKLIPNTLIEEEFNNNTNNWIISKDNDAYGNYSREIVDGKFVFNILPKKNISIVTVADKQLISNYKLSTEAKFSKGDLSSSELTDKSPSALGLVFNYYNNSNYHLFLISPQNQKCSFLMKKDGNWKFIINWKDCSSIKTTENNMLEIFVKDNNYELFINGNSEISIKDNSLPQYGQFGLTVQVFNDFKETTAEFEYLKIEILE